MYPKLVYNKVKYYLSQITTASKSRILMLDGAMGTMLQKKQLEEEVLQRLPHRIRWRVGWRVAALVALLEKRRKVLRQW